MFRGRVSFWSPLPDHLTANSWSCWTVESAKGRDIWIAPLRGARKLQLFLQTKFNEMQARFSPNDRWIAYMSEEWAVTKFTCNPSRSGRQMADFDQQRHHPCVVAEWSRAILYELRKAHECGRNGPTHVQRIHSTNRRRLSSISDGSAKQRILRRESRQRFLFVKAKFRVWTSRRGAHCIELDREP